MATSNTPAVAVVVATAIADVVAATLRDEEEAAHHVSRISHHLQIPPSAPLRILPRCRGRTSYSLSGPSRNSREAGCDEAESWQQATLQ